METMIELSKKDTKIAIANGSLRSFLVKKQQWIHQPTDPGWGKSDDEMFPVIGPTNAVKSQIETPKGISSLDQHGILRALDWVLILQSEVSALFEKRYTANTQIKNPKYPGKSDVPFLHWTYDFVLKKRFVLDEQGLLVQFTIDADQAMPFQMGYHPAFRLETKEVSINCSDQNFSFDQIFKSGEKAFPLKNCHELTLIDGKKRKLMIKTEGFGHFMCWTEVSSMICIEPITHYPVDFDLSQFSAEAFHINEKGTVSFSFWLIPK
jgi:galactose mutarotase-like enzyme